MLSIICCDVVTPVALFTRAWIEISRNRETTGTWLVALFTRAWIEIATEIADMMIGGGRPLHEGVD